MLQDMNHCYDIDLLTHLRRIWIDVEFQVFAWCARFNTAYVPTSLLRSAKQFPRSTAKVTKRRWPSKAFNYVEADAGIARFRHGVALVTVRIIKAFKILSRRARIDEAHVTSVATGETKGLGKHTLSNCNRRCGNAFPATSTQRAGGQGLHKVQRCLVADILLFSAPKFNARQCALLLGFLLVRYWYKVSWTGGGQQSNLFGRHSSWTKWNERRSDRQRRQQHADHPGNGADRQQPNQCCADNKCRRTVRLQRLAQ